MNKWKIVSGILLACWAYDTKVARHNRRIYERNLAKREADLEVMESVARLYAVELRDAGVPLNAFTRIALDSILENMPH